MILIWRKDGDGDGDGDGETVHVNIVRACVLCGVVGAPRATLDVLVPFVSSPFLLCYSPCVLWFLCCLFGLWWSYPFPFPLSLIVVWCMCILCLGSGLLVWRVCQRPREARESPPPLVGVGRRGCVVVCDMALWYWQRSWLPLSSCVSVPLCVPLYFCFCVSRRVSRDLS